MQTKPKVQTQILNFMKMKHMVFREETNHLYNRQNFQ